MKRTLIALLCAGVLAGCTLDPTYHRPPAPVDRTWSTAPAPAQQKVSPNTAPAPLAAEIGWRDFFRDARLQKLIEIALANNRDMRIAALNVAQYEAQYRIARANLAPTISASGSVTRERAEGATSAYSSSSASVGLTSWEIDFFGRLRSLKHQALEQYLATDAACTSTQISLIATVATDYLQLLSDEASLQITLDTVDADHHSYDLTVSMMKMGSASLQDVRQSENSLASARSSLASYTRAVAQDRNNLAAEIGGPLPDDMPQGYSLMESDNIFADIGAGVPSDLLTRRPDIVEAEHTLKAANANIGAARAAFFPKIELTASAGTTSSSLSNLFKAGTGAWMFEPSISVPIFDFGYNRATLDVAKIEKDIDIANYEKTIQTAFKEVSNALAGRTTYVTQVAADRDYVNSAQQYYDLAQARYRSGTDSFLTLLDAQRTFYTAQQQLVTDTLAKQSNLITLYKVLGGGWSETSVMALR
ncbi:efflux transporter outer membrane subunit [Burkholderia plantarii]|uniref:efflux transporter outer membrane subunit n=1 Tax=Burkholderia plantarii TaxID=41899 RepID=UPI0006D8CC0A|nr:efflux transporter outer membrane subunit [Burkholderia plantarii]ALK33551.1 RND efflux system, outer membrane lipoprotein, NodT [Burkholderia plantarii]GLZ16731.1 outer membrane protein OprM [Burkholderia plantarii]